MERLWDNKAVGRKAFAGGIVDTAGINITNCDGCAPRLTGHSGSQESDSTGPDDKGRRPRLRSGTIDSMDGNRERLQEGGSIKGDMLGQPKGWIISGILFGEKQEAYL